MRHRALLVAVAVLGALALAGTAAGAGGSGWSSWQPYRSKPFSYAAGDVCAFPVRVTPTVDRERIRTHTDAAGNVDLEEVTGTLFTRITNTATGASVVRNLSGKGVFELGRGTMTLDVAGHAMSGFHAGDAPAHELLVFSGNTQIVFHADGTRTLTRQNGTAEDLCTTLG